MWMARVTSVAAISERFGVRGRPAEIAACAEITSGSLTPIVRSRGGKREVASLLWGLTGAHPLGDAPVTAVTARSIDRMALLQDLFPTQRCIVPVDAFFAGPVAWARAAPVWEFRLLDEGLMGIAGIWLGLPGEVESFAIITTGPNESVALIEDAMPAILYPRDEAQWLSPRTDPYRAHCLLMPYPAEKMRARPLPAQANLDLLHRVA
jgi:putative SOS response-associated peptidase YedK